MNEYPDWRMIQKGLKSGRICPICGKILKNHFLKHLGIHGLTIKDYIILRDNLSEFPKCPICKKDRSINKHGYYINSTCSDWHCMHSQSNNTRVKHGNHNFAYSGDPEHDKIKYKELHDKAIQRIVRGDNILAYNGDPEHDKKVLEFHRWKLTLRDSKGLCGWHSRPEHEIANILNRLNLKYIREFNLLGGKYRADYLLPDYNLIIECNGGYKYSDRNNEDSIGEYYKTRKSEIEDKTKFRIVDIYYKDVYYFKNNPRDLLIKLGIYALELRINYS